MIPVHDKYIILLAQYSALSIQFIVILAIPAQSEDDQQLTHYSSMRASLMEVWMLLLLDNDIVRIKATRSSIPRHNHKLT